MQQRHNKFRQNKGSDKQVHVRGRKHSERVSNEFPSARTCRQKLSRCTQRDTPAEVNMPCNALQYDSVVEEIQDGPKVDTSEKAVSLSAVQLIVAA